jgi:hypothetical protein
VFFVLPEIIGKPARRGKRRRSLCRVDGGAKRRAVAGTSHRFRVSITQSADSGHTPLRAFAAREAHMKKIVAAAVMTLWFVPTGALANNERVGGAALGALAGAVVLGPVGAVVGAAVGFAAAPSVANGFKPAEPPTPQPRKPARNTASKPVPLPQAKPAQAKPAQAKSAEAYDANARAQAPVKPTAHTDAAARQVPH